MGNWIAGAVKRPGAFTAKAKAAGEGVQQYASEKASAPGLLGKQARLAKTFGKMGKKKRKKKRGGAIAGMLAGRFGPKDGSGGQSAFGGKKAPPFGRQAPPNY